LTEFAAMVGIRTEKSTERSAKWGVDNLEVVMEMFERLQMTSPLQHKKFIST